MGKNLKLLLLTATFSSVYAQELKIETSYKTKTTQSENTSVIEVITEDDIKEEHPEFITDVLSNIPEISFTSNGGFGQPTSVYLRGFDPKRTLVLLDGIRLNDLTGLNGAQFELYNLEDVKQVEIIEGAQSGIWGADASAGVINIITKTPKKGFHSKGLLEYGSFNTYKYGASISYRNNNFYFLGSYYLFNTDGFSAAEPKKGSKDYGKRGDELGWEKDGYKNKTYTLKAGVSLFEKNSIEFLFRGIDAKIHFDAAAGVDAKDLDNPFGFGLTSYINDINNKFYSVKFNHKDKNNNFKTYYNYSLFKRSQLGGYSGKIKEFGIQDKYQYLKNSFFVLGAVSQKFTHNKSAGTDLNKSYTDKGIFITNVNRFKNIIITESLRRDDYDKFQDKTTWKAGIKYIFNNKTYISANYGTAYNIPTLYQLFDSYVGNANLKPEDVKGYDFSLGFHGFSITYFYNEIKDLIDYSFSTNKFENIEGKSKIKGISTIYKNSFKPLKLKFYLGYTYLDAKDSKGNKLLRRPENKINFKLSWYPLEKFNATLKGEYIGKRKDLNNIQTGYYSVYDLIMNYRLNRYSNLYLKINNITDKYYQTINGYATAKRSYFAGLIARF